jgi:hypothetical protein
LSFSKALFWDSLVNLPNERNLKNLNCRHSWDPWKI